MNPRQRRAILLIGLSALGLLGVFALVAGYVSDVRADVDPKVSVLALSTTVKPYTTLTDNMVKEVEMPAKWAPRTALRDRSAYSGLVATTALTADSILQEGMLAAPPELEAGQREVAILVDAKTGVAGKIGPGSIVDIIATYPASEDEGGGRVLARSRIVVPGARVVEVGQPQQQQSREVRQAQQDPQQTVPITFAISVRDQLKVTYAESLAQEVRLALQRPDEQERVVPKNQRVYAPKTP